MKLTRRSVWRTALATPLALAGFSSTRSSAEGRVQLAQATAPGQTNARDPRINDRSTRSAGVRKVASRAELKALEPASHGAALLVEPGREGLFRWDARVAPGEHRADVTEALLVAPDTSGEGAWRRVFNGAVDPRWFGAIADWNGSAGTDNTRALQAAVDSRQPVHVPRGRYLSGSITLPSGTVLTSEPGAEITFNPRTFTGLYCDRVSGITIRGLTLIGQSDNSAQSAAIYLRRTERFVVADVVLEGWADHGILAWGTPEQQSGHGIIERITARNWARPIRFGASCVSLYQNTHDITVAHCDLQARASYAIRAQDISGGVHAGTVGHKFHHNRCRNALAYGIMIYENGLLIPVTATARGPNGVVRVTCVNHRLQTGRTVVVAGIEGTEEANGRWRAVVVDADTIDLEGTIYENAYRRAGLVALSESTRTEVSFNTIEDIDGTEIPENNNNGHFGGGIYVAAAADILIHGNVIRRTNLGTSGESLVPAGIGINSSHGAVTITSNWIEDCAWYGIEVFESRGAGGTVVIANNTVRNCAKIQLYARSGNATITGNTLVARPGSPIAQPLFVRGSTRGSPSRNMTVSGNVCRAFGQNRPFRIADVSDVAVHGNVVTNDGLATGIEMAAFENIATATVSGNVFDGRVSTSTGLIINSVTNATFSGNRVAMSEGRPARPCVIMQGNCSGTIYEVSNANATTRIRNTSSGTVHNRAASPSDEGETRQDGDVIWNSDLANGGPLAWVRARGAWGAPHGGAR